MGAKFATTIFGDLNIEVDIDSFIWKSFPGETMSSLMLFFYFGPLDTYIVIQCTSPGTWAQLLSCCKSAVAFTFVGSLC